jgi:ribose 5-phosphate isomerase A
MDADRLKLMAAERALGHVESGMKLGLGSGSTAAMFVELLSGELKAGLKIVCVPTSEVVRSQAMALGIPITTLDDEPHLDLTIDGADEIDDQLRLIKGGGGALLHEKIVATASDRMIVIADASKLVKTLGTFPLPVEVVRFGLAATREMIEALAAEAGCEGPITLRRTTNNHPFVTDSGNYILDCAFGAISEPEALDEALRLVPGVVENGLFLDVADLAIIAGEEGITTLQASANSE